MKQAIIDVKHLTKTYNGRVVVNNIDLQVKRGEIYGFLGPNGSGKTTTIRMLCGLLTPDQGEGTCLGYNLLTEAHLIKRNVGYMTQKFGLYEDLTIFENLDFIARVYDVENREKVIKDTLYDLGLTYRQDQLAGTLSGGWKQRMALAACILHNPKLLLLDEPTAGVDPQARREFWDEIHHLSSKGVTILVSTHYMDEAERCHKIAYINMGNMLIRGTISEVIAKSHLITWSVTGENLDSLAAELKTLDGIDQVAPFGMTLHVCGVNPEKLMHAIEPYLQQPKYHWKPTQPSLEDVFIQMMGKSNHHAS
jgi:ABC-2 type transport system ATP-binding protein